MRRIIPGLICLVMLFFTGCDDGKNIPAVPENSKLAETDNSSSVPSDVLSEPELAQDVKAISAKWQDDKLLYLTDNGVFAYSPSDGSTKTLMAANMSISNIDTVKYYLSPDESKLIVLTMGSCGNSLEIRNTESDKSMRIIDTQKYRDGVGKYIPPVSEAGWIDNQNIFISTEFRLFILNIMTGEEIQVTEECSPVTTKANSNVEAPYLSWAANVIKMGDKLYYNSKRDINFSSSLQSIYCGDKSGEQELLQNARILLSVSDTRFVYEKEEKILIYDTERGISLIFNDYILDGKVCCLNDSILSCMTGDRTGGSYQGLIFDLEKLQTLVFAVYDGERDFPDKDIDRRQFGNFTGALAQNGVYLFLFSVENHSQSQQKYITQYLSYNTKTEKLTPITYDKGMCDMILSPTGEYLLIKKYKNQTDNYFMFDVKKADSLWRSNNV